MSIAHRVALALGPAAILAFGAEPAAPATINLSACKPVFEDRFRSLDVSPHGPGTRWIAHTPWFGDFGDAQFTDPTGDFPFKTGPGGLTITARKDGTGKWRSGLLSSVDTQGRGFSAQYGYFEMEGALPPGKGSWPAFWLHTADRNTNPDIEIDVLEYYGHWTDRYQMVVTARPKGGKGSKSATKWVHFKPGALINQMHTYGVAVGRRHVVFYLDRREVWRTPTPPEHKKPLGILVNLALGSGWPIDETPNPSVMKVARISYFDVQRCGVPPSAAGE